MPRRLLALPAVAAVIVTGVIVGPSFADRLRHPRDEDAFQTYVETYILNPGTGVDKRWVVDHPTETLAEGDRACAWLSRRNDAPDLDPSGATAVDTLAYAYVKDARQEHVLPLTRHGHASIVYGAWEYLCQPTRHDKTAPQSEIDD